ncbi:MAG: hypothetical protein IJU40_08325 [Desulfovibrionaceae bacterium]|nr:hypothetical protein [Desulfovibrionaceae bacterium]
MRPTNLSRLVAIGLFLVALILTISTASWHIHAVHQDADKILASKATNVAEQLSALLSLPGYKLDVALARPLVFAALKNSELFAVKILDNEGLLEGQRRSSQGELEPWDGEIPEKTVQAICPIWAENKRVGSVDVYLRVDSTLGLVDKVAWQEVSRFILTLLFTSLCLLLYLWQTGDLKTILEGLQAYFKKLQARSEPRIIKSSDRLASVVNQTQNQQILDQKAAKDYWQQEKPPLGVAQGLFAYTFKHTPKILTTLASEKKLTQLKHLISLLNQSAPCIGAHRLTQSTEELLKALQKTEIPHLEIQNCIQELNLILAKLSKDSMAEKKPSS